MTTGETASGRATDAPPDDKSLNRRVIALAVAAAVGGFLFGFDSSVVNGAVLAVQEDFGLSELLIGFAVASALLGCALGANFAITVSFPHLSELSLPFTYGMYAVFAALSFFFVLVKIPETNGLSLEEAETLFVTKPKGTRVTAALKR